MLVATFVAAPCLGVVDAESSTTSRDVGLCDIGVRSHYMHVDVCASLRRLVYGVDKLGTAVGLDGVVAAVVGNEHVLKIVALGNANGNRQHDAVAERHHRRFHVL